MKSNQVSQGFRNRVVRGTERFGDARTLDDMLGQFTLGLFVVDLDGGRAGDVVRGRNICKPLEETGGGVAIVAVVVADPLQDRTLLPCAPLAACQPVGVLDNRVGRRCDVRRSPLAIEMLDTFDGVAVLAKSNPISNGVIEINEEALPEHVIDFILPCVMTCAQSPDRAHFIGGVVVDVHSGIAAPTVVHPVDKSLERQLLLGPIVCPPVDEFERR